MKVHVCNNSKIIWCWYIKWIDVLNRVLESYLYQHYDYINYRGYNTVNDYILTSVYVSVIILKVSFRHRTNYSTSVIYWLVFIILHWCFAFHCYFFFLHKAKVKITKIKSKKTQKIRKTMSYRGRRILSNFITLHVQV